MIIINPHMLPKVRSRALLDATSEMPCSLRIASFIPGYSCAPQSTVVPCHLPIFGKGMSTKVSDLLVAAGCLNCHRLLDRVDKRIIEIEEHHGVELQKQLMRAWAETLTRWLDMGLIVITGGELT